MYPQNPGSPPPPYGQAPYAGQQPDAYAPQPGGYGAPPPYGAPQGPFAPAATSGPAPEGVRSAGTLAVGALAIAAARPVLVRVLGLAGVRLGSAAVYDALRLVIALVAIVFYLIWFARIHAWVRATQGTKHTTGLAVGGWFIPFVNFVLPCTALADVWRRVRNEGAGIIVAWWLVYLFSSVLQTTVSMIPLLSRSGALGHGLADVFNALFWVNTLGAVAAYGFWAYLVQALTASAMTPRR